MADCSAHTAAMTHLPCPTGGSTCQARPLCMQRGISFRSVRPSSCMRAYQGKSKLVAVPVSLCSRILSLQASSEGFFGCSEALRPAGRNVPRYRHFHPPHRVCRAASTEFTKLPTGRAYKNPWFPLTKARTQISDTLERTFKSELLRRSVVTIFLVAVARAGFHIPLPGFDRELMTQAKMLGVTSVYDGVALNMFELGMGPYISASIVLSVLVNIPPLSESKKEGGYEFQENVKKWQKYLTLGIALINSGMILHQAKQFSVYAAQSLVKYYFWNTALLMAGATMLFYIGEGITNAGFGNGSGAIVSLSILGGFGGFVSRITDSIASAALPHWQAALFGLCFLGTIVGAVYLVQGVRKVPIVFYQPEDENPGTHMVDIKEEQYIPFNVNPSGMAPLMGASFFFEGVRFGSSFSRGKMPLDFLQDRASPLFYGLYFVSVFLTNMVDLSDSPKQISDYLTRINARIPNVTPGSRTVEYLRQIQKTSSFWGGLLLAGLAAFSLALDNRFRGAHLGPNIGITSVLILVGHIIQVSRSIEAYSQGPRLQKVLKKYLG